MRIVVLGGAGAIGSALTEDLAGCPEVDELVVADVDASRAEALVRSLGQPHVRAVRIDVHDRVSALALLDGVDLLMNCTSFTVFDQVIELAVAARVSYADLISEPTDAQRRGVEAAGITAISGLGASPGLTNVLVRHAAEELGPPEEAHLSWASFRAIAPSPGLLDTILWELADGCPTRQVFINGRYEHARFMEGSRVVEFAAPLGAQRVYYVPHPEVRTLPACFPSLRFCAVRGTWRPELMDDIRVLNKYGLLDPEVIEQTKARIWARFGGERDDNPWRLFVHVEVVARGRRRIYRASHPDWGQEGTGKMTGICASVGAQLLARHGTRRAGFVDPEEYFDPHEFLDELAKRRSVEVAWHDEEIEGGPRERLAEQRH